MARRSMPTPVNVTQDAASRELVITWNDTHTSRYPFRMLRQACPCAMCVHEWSGEQLLDPSRIPADIHPKDIAGVGAYALRFNWSDGHQTGIYTFAYLRSLCPCDACTRERQQVSRPPSDT
jgi:DUF971 family protein